jgi:hypothetical protein
MMEINNLYLYYVTYQLKEKMTTTAKTTESNYEEVGRVVIIHDNVKAISADGVERLLSVNSPVFANDKIVTESNGSVSILMNDASHSQLNVGRMSEILIDEDIYGGISTEEIAEAVVDVEHMLEAFFIEGVDLTIESESPFSDDEIQIGNKNQVTDSKHTMHEGDLYNSVSKMTPVIFDQSDYADLDEEPLANLIDSEDTTS